LAWIGSALLVFRLAASLVQTGYLVAVGRFDFAVIGKFYEQCLGGHLGAIFRYGGTPLAGHVPE
jgi:hypothetical protein